METLAERFDKIFAVDPLSVAVEQGTSRFGYGAIRSFVEKLDHILQAADLKASTPVAVLLRNHPVNLAAALALVWTERCLVTVNPLLPDKSMKTDLMSLAVPAVIAVRADWERPLFSQTVRASGAMGIEIFQEQGVFGVRTLFGRRAEQSFRPQEPGIAVEMLTSGTTGAPKRIKLKRDSLSRSLFAGSQYESSGSTVALQKSPSVLWMPLAHIGGLWNAFYQLYNGRRILLLERFQMDVWHDAIVNFKLRFATLPPSMLGQVLERNYPREDFATLLAIRCGAAPLDHRLAEEFEQRYGVPVLEAYGATEFAGGVAGWTIKDHRAFSKHKRDSVGRANAGVQLRIVNQSTFEPVATGSTGLLEVSMDQVDAGAWVRTTDVAKLDEEGFLYILGRADNAINRGGFKIMPENVEAALRSHPDIEDACVVGIDDAQVGKVPVAAYELKPQALAPSPETLKAYLAEILKPYEIPARFIAVPELPRTLSLKVSQLAVRELFTVQDVHAH